MFSETKQIRRSKPADIVLSFDVEEHFRIEAGAGLSIDPSLQAHYRSRLRPSVFLVLNELARGDHTATFFIVGEIARHSPDLVKAIHRAGHEVASHSWQHRRVHTFTPEQFRADLRMSKDALEQCVGDEVVGFRAPTFSITPQTPWAIDVLVEEGFLYDSSIYPVRHDRYGIPDAPRVPFWAKGVKQRILELPPATWQLFGMNLPVGGGGYFRLFPQACVDAGIRQLRNRSAPMLYFHPWEFDVRQRKLALGTLSSFRTYCGIHRSQNKLRLLLSLYKGMTALQQIRRMQSTGLTGFPIGAQVQWQTGPSNEMRQTRATNTEADEV